MNLSFLKNKKIAVLGLGIENFALLNFLLAKKISSSFTVFDARQAKELGHKQKILAGKPIKWQVYQPDKTNFKKYDILFRSPGWPLFDENISKAKKQGIVVSSPMQLFFKLCPTKNIVGVTGTKGKGTTSSLIAKMLEKGKKRVWLGGNIGIAPFGFIHKIKKHDWVVLELSSFQLEDLKQSPKIAVITNFYPEHLQAADPLNPNFHRSLSDYWQAKYNIVRWQKNNCCAIINYKLKTKLAKNNPVSKIYFFSGRDNKADAYFISDDLVLLETQFQTAVKVPGKHNKENIAAAALAARLAGASIKHINNAISEFCGLEHRLELIANAGGIQYYNDSFATTPEAAITALRSFSRPIVLIAGGAEKNSDFAELAKEIKAKAKFVVLLKGKTTPRLKKDIEKTGFDKTKIKTATNMAAAVKTAYVQAQPGDIILLSPACASFGLFNNYKERGEQFRKEVEKLTQK